MSPSATMWICVENESMYSCDTECSLQSKGLASYANIIIISSAQSRWFVCSEFGWWCSWLQSVLLHAPVVHHTVLCCPLWCVCFWNVSRSPHARDSDTLLWACLHIKATIPCSIPCFTTRKICTVINADGAWRAENVQEKRARWRRKRVDKICRYAIVHHLMRCVTCVCLSFRRLDVGVWHNVWTWYMRFNKWPRAIAIQCKSQTPETTKQRMRDQH